MENGNKWRQNLTVQWKMLYSACYNYHNNVSISISIKTDQKLDSSNVAEFPQIKSIMPKMLFSMYKEYNQHNSVTNYNVIMCN